MFASYHFFNLQAGQLMSTLSETSHINELKTFLEDKEMVLQAIQLSHEKHEELINNMEARISERERTFTDKKVLYFKNYFFKRRFNHYVIPSICEIDREFQKYLI